MAEVFMYVDESGNLDLGGHAGASRYFVVGSAALTGAHGEVLWTGAQLRFRHEQAGLEVAGGYHAKDDSPRTRHDVYQAVASVAPRYDFTILDKTRLYPNVRAQGEVYLYKLAWYLHFKAVAPAIARAGDTLFVAAGTLGTKARRRQARRALAEVCEQVAARHGRRFTAVLATWDANTSFGIQLADYGLWAAQRGFERSDWSWYERYVEPETATCYDVFN